jgi:hypothetical protein
MSTFAERIDQLKEMVGSGDLTGKVEVSQVYAKYQHEGLDFAHPRGGEAQYLRRPLFDHYRSYLQKVADGILDDGGKRAMADCMERLAEEDGVATRAPLEWGDLRDSGHPSVTSDGATTYDRPPRQHRLTEEELKVKYRLHHPHVSALTAKQRAYLYGMGILGREET